MTEMQIGDGKADDFEIIDVENYSDSKEKVYNTQTLIMKQMDLCLKNGSVEMVEGYWDDKVDKNGNVLRTYHPDSRRTFIESVKSLMMFCHQYYKEDPKTSKKIEDMKNQLKIRKNFWLNEEWRWWCSMNPMQRQIETNKGKMVSQGCFNKKNEFDNFYYDEELQIYRDIFQTITDFIRDNMKEFEAEVYTG